MLYLINKNIVLDVTIYIPFIIINIEAHNVYQNE